MTFEKVKEIIMDTINCSEDKITLEANLKDDLGIDSLDSMELMMAVEDAYGITVPEEELPNLTSVKAIVEYNTHLWTSAFRIYYSDLSLWMFLQIHCSRCHCRIICS